MSKMNFELNSSLLNDDAVDAAAAAAKKDSLMERLNKRYKDRQNYLDNKLEERNKECVQFEGIDYFTQTYMKRVHDIETRIANIYDTALKKSGGDGPNVDLTPYFSTITYDIQELQRYLTNSTLFLTDFKIKSCQNALNELTSNCEKARSKLMPKKKFGFSGRKVTTKTQLNPKLNVAHGIDVNDHKTLNKTINSTLFSWTLSNRTNEYILLQNDEVNSKDITISNLNNCFVEIQGNAGSVQITNANDCIIVCGPITRSFFAENCLCCIFALACQQMRLHSSSICRIYLHVTCRAIIEDCKDIDIANYYYDYKMIDLDFQKSGLDRTHNNYTDIADFNWLSTDAPSPNWKLLSDSTKPDWNEMRDNFNRQLAHTNNDNAAI